MTAYWKIRRALAARARRGECRHLGRAAQDAAVQVEPERLRAHGVTLDEVMEATADALDCGVARSIQTARPSAPEGSSIPPIKGSQIRHISPIINPEDMAQVPIKVEERRHAAPPA